MYTNTVSVQCTHSRDPSLSAGADRECTVPGYPGTVRTVSIIALTYCTVLYVSFIKMYHTVQLN